MCLRLNHEFLVTDCWGGCEGEVGRALCFCLSWLVGGGGTRAGLGEDTQGSASDGVYMACLGQSGDRELTNVPCWICGFKAGAFQVGGEDYGILPCRVDIQNISHPWRPRTDRTE